MNPSQIHSLSVRHRSWNLSNVLPKTNRWIEVKLLYGRHWTETRSSTRLRSAINVDKTSFEEWSDTYKKNLEFFPQNSQNGLQPQDKMICTEHTSHQKIISYLSPEIEIPACKFSSFIIFRRNKEHPSTISRTKASAEVA